MMTLGDIRALVHNYITPLRRDVANMTARAVVQLVSNLPSIQTMQVGVLDGESVDEIEHYQPYGFSSVPPVGSNAIVLFPGGDRASGVVIVATERGTRPTDQEPGEVAIYHRSGARVEFKDNGDVLAYPSGAGVVRLGDPSATLAAATNVDLKALVSAIAAAAVAAGDGGLTFKANILAALAMIPGYPVGALRVKVK